MATINFSKKIPDELYIDSFKENKQMDLVYDGPDILYIVLSKYHGTYVETINSLDELRHPDDNTVLTVTAANTPDAAYYYYHFRDMLIREHATEVLSDGTTHDYINNPALRDYYELVYNFENRRFIWKVITRDPRNILNFMAEKYRSYVIDNANSYSSNTSLKTIADNYIKVLDDYETTGPASIPSWKVIEANTATVPFVPVELIAAIKKFPEA